MTYIEQIPACDLDELVQLVEVYALKLKKEREQKEKERHTDQVEDALDGSQKPSPVYQKRR